ncbi:MAG: DUF1571 domain-containing protein [Candidatus Auribacterota bacterium]|jgi:hypothetical protein|nr:DUF1571 domain-containing protein [Candidatus Auribacterota bacterium]
MLNNKNFIVVSWVVAMLFSGMFSLEAQTQENAALAILKDSRDRYDKYVEDYTATFYKTQRINNAIKNEVIEIKFMKPFCVYFKFLKPDAGKEVIYVEGKNNNKLIGHLGGAISLIPISRWLSPTDPMAMAGNKYPITRTGIGNMLDSLISQYDLAQANGDLEAYYMGVEILDGRPTHVIVRRLPPSKDYACYFSVTNIDIETKLPIRNVSLDENFELLEMYYYSSIKVNVGLTEKDFDPNNSAYKFGFFKL